MSKNKGDLEIGERFFEEVMRIFGSARKGAEAMGISSQIIYDYKYGKTPGGLSLARLHYCGGDVICVLTGRRAEDGKI